MNKPLSPLNGKKILFIGVKFYYYTADIVKKMREEGATVYFFYERDVTVRHAIITTFFSKYLDRWQARHYNRIIHEMKEVPLDYLFVVRGYKMEGWFIDQIKTTHPGIKTILYQWDSLRNWDCDYQPLLPYFDRSYTFDYQDAKDLAIPYIPTFHIDEFARLPAVAPQYDLFYFGGYNYERYAFIKRLIDYAAAHGLKLKTHLYMPWKQYLLSRLHGTFIDSKYITFHKMGRKEYVDVFNKSKVIVDLPNSIQTGMAMRVIDALGAGKRVLTANPSAALEPGFDPQQVIIFDKDKIDFPEWITDGKPFAKKDYTISKWLERIFS